MAVGDKPKIIVAADGLPGTPFTAARFCSECELSTAYAVCPGCAGLTVEHPGQKDAHHYCWRCCDEFPPEKLRVETWEENSYIQCDGDMITTCLKCLKKTQGEI